jgi:gluconokinase
MGTTLLHSQFEALEPPEGAVRIDIAPPPEVIAAAIRLDLGIHDQRETATGEA